MAESSSHLRSAPARATRDVAPAHSTINLASDPTDAPSAAGSDGSAITAVISSDDIASGSSQSVPAVAPGAADEVVVDDRTVISSSPPEGRPRGGSQSAAELGRLLIGELLDHFQLEQYIGGGGMGAVFRGTDTLLARQVAVKVLSRQHAIDEETTRRFRNEAQSAARLDHDNIARVYFVGVDRGWHYIVLEYIEGENARDLVAQRGPLPMANVLDITLQVAEALEHAASRDVVHRDVKPSNVLVTREGHVKLVDMGLARLRQVEQSVDDITATGVTLGTFDYISPEQARDPRAADVRSDLYSLGCTMYYMLCGQPPFPEGTVLQKLLQHQGDEAPDCRQLRPEIPDVVASIVGKLLCKNPLDRYQQPRDLIADLLLACDQLGVTLSRGRTAIYVATPEARTQWAQRHLPWLVPIFLLVIAVLGIEVFGSRSGALPDPRPLAGGEARPVKPAADSINDGKGDGNAAVASGGAAAPTKLVKRGEADHLVTGAQPRAGSDELVRQGNEPRDKDSPANPSVQPQGDRAVKQGSEGSLRDGIAGPIGPPSTAPRAASLPSGPGLKNDDLASASIVAITSTGQRSYTTLQEACGQAPSGCVVELRYNGRRQEQPIVVSNRELTVRAAEGFHPVVLFRPEESDPLLSPHSMVSVSGGALTLVNLELEMRMPQRIHSEGLALVEAVLADKVRLERCTLTISNPGAQRATMTQDASFFSVKTAPRRESGMMADSPTMDSRVSIELRNCIVRGDGAMLSGDALATVSLQWENGLLATSQSLLEMAGADQAIPATAQLQIDLQHVTARMRRGMCRIVTREDQHYLPQVRINCTDCILLTDGAPLIDQRGDESVEEQQKALLWKGNRNFYEGIEVFWQIDGPRTAGPTQINWTAWRDHWGAGRETTERSASVAFAQLPDRQSPASAHSPADYLLDESEQYNPALGTATDGTSDVGLKAELLPVPPASTSAAPEAKGTASEPPATEGPVPPPVPRLKPTAPEEE